MDRVAKFFRDYAFARFFIPFGLVAIVIGCLLFGSASNRQNYPRTEAVVTGSELYQEAYDQGDTHHDATYTLFIRYTADGQEYEDRLDDLPEMSVGSTLTIDYNSKDPHDISRPTGFVLPIVLAAVGIVALIAGVVSIVNTRNRNRKLKQQEEEWTHGN